MSIIKLQGTSTVVDNVTIEPISNIGKLYVNEDVTLNEIDSIRYAAYQPQVSTKSIPFLDTDTEYSYFNKLADEVKTLHLQADEYNTSAHYDSLQILNKYNNVNTPDGSITLIDLLGIVKSTYASLNDIIHYNNGVYKKIILDSDEMILLAMGQIKKLGDGLLETEAGLKITMDSVKMYVDSVYTDVNGRLENFNSLLITTEGLLLSAVENKLDAYGNYIYKNYASLTVFNDRIATLVGREDFDEHGRMISRNTSSIVQLATEISLKVTGEQFDEMGELVRKAESSITMLEGSITSKVSLQEYEQFKIGNDQWLDLVAKHETKIEQLPDAIKMSVKSSYIDDLIEGLNDVKGTNKVLDDYLHTVGTSLSDVLKAYETMEIKSNALAEDYSGIYGLALVQQASIDILEGEIVLKASSLYVNPETGKVTTLSSMLDILSGKIGMLVSKDGDIRGGIIISAINDTDTDETGAKITIAGARLNVNANTTFSPGYNPGVKNSCFMQEPKPPYQKGDVWIKDEEYYTSEVERLDGSFISKDWVKSLKYTDDSLARTMTKVYRQDNDPQGLWLDNAAKDEHLDDQWITIDPEISATTAVLKRYVKNLINGSYSYAWELDQTIIDAGRIITNKVFAERIYAAGATIGGFEIYKGTQTVNGVEVEYDYLRTTEQPNPWASDLNQGIWLGKDQGIYKFFVGNSKEYIVFDGTNLIISGYTRLGNNTDYVTIDDLGVLNKYFKIVNPGLENEYIQVLGHMCATGNIAAYRGNSDVFPDKIWQAIPDAGYGADGNRGLVRIGDGLTINSFGVLSVSGGIGTQSLKFENKVLTLSGGGGSVDLSSFASSWDDISNKPISFTPAVHSHTFDSITDKPTEFNPSAHNHTFESLTSKPTTLVGYGITDSLLRHYGGVADLNSIGIEGVFTTVINPANAYNKQWAVGFELHIDHNPLFRHQLIMSIDGGISYRQSHTGEWKDWRTVWDSYTFNPNNKAELNGNSAVAFNASQIILANLTQSTVLVSDTSNKIISSSVTSDKLLKLAQMFDLVQPAGGTSYIKANYSLMSVGGLTAYAQATSNEGLWGQMPFATTTTRGGVIVGQGLDINNGILSVNSSYGAQLISLSGNTLNLSGNGGSVDLSTIVPTWANISGKPVTFEANGFKALSSAGFYFVNDLYGGGSDTAGMRLLQKTVGTENITLELYTTNDDTDTINFSTPAINGVTVNSYPVWHTGNLTGDQGGHYHSSDRQWGNITGKPTTLNGYGITDAIPKLTIDATHQDEVQWSGFYRSNAGTLRQYINLRHPESTAYGFQIGNAYDDALRFRNRIAGVWGAYHAIWHDGNFTPANYSLTSHAHTTSVITEGTNLYYTQSRFDSAFSNKSTSNLQEGTNLYFTDARARNACAVSGQVYDSARLGGVVASSYTRRNVAETIGQLWTFNSGLVASQVNVNGNYIAIKGVTTSACLSLDGVAGAWSYLRFMINGVLRWDVGIDDVNNKFEFRPNQVTVATIDVNGKITSKSIVAENTITSNNIGITSTTGIGDGVSLYNGQNATTTQSTYTFPTYGMFFGKTANFGTFGGVTSDWAVYFTINDVVNRGWIFKKGTTNVLSISTAGNAYANGEISAIKYYARNSGGLCFQAGDDAAIWDVNIAHTLGVYSATNNAVGGIQLGSGGIKLYGTSGSLYAYGNIIATGALTCYTASDINLKTEIEPITNALDILKLTNPVKFKWNAIAKKLNNEFINHEQSASFIAQEYEKVFPWAINAIWDVYKGIDTQIMIPYVVAGINELNIKTDTIEDRLNRRIEELEREVKQLKSMTL